MTTRPPQTSPPAAPHPGKRHATNSTPEGTTTPASDEERAAQRALWKAAVSARNADQYGDKARRRRAVRPAAYRPGQNRKDAP